MNRRERFNAVMHYQDVDRVPCLAMGYWLDTIDKWEAEGHLPKGTAAEYRAIRKVMLPDDTPLEREIDAMLGFDNNIQCIYMQAFPLNSSLYPFFSQDVLKVREDGSEEYMSYEGVVMLRKYSRSGNAVTAISQHLRHTLVDRESWEKEYLPRLQYDPTRFDYAELEQMRKESDTRAWPLGLHCGSLLGQIRNWLGFEQLCYMPYDDPDLLDEMIQTVADLQYKNVETQLKAGVKFDYAHFWEDMCGNDGPLVNPDYYEEHVGPYYERICDLLKHYGIDIISLDSDGKVDALVPTWMRHGINTLFPLEYGIWQGNIGPFKAQYGDAIHGFGGMRKNAFAEDKAAIDAELERLKPLIEMGGYIPSPDHRIPPEAKWELVQYYTDRFKTMFSR